MVPIIWRFLLNQYLKVMSLCVAAIVVVLLTTRLEDIAHFASLDATLGVIVMFVWHQVPYILPIALPISCLISSILLVQQLSKTHELTALRACGMALKDFIAPILIAGAFLTIVNFYIVSEAATVSHLYTNLWKSELRSVNPLLLLKNKHLIKLKGAYFDAMGASQVGESASQAILAIPNRSSQRITLFLADKMVGDQDSLRSRKATLLTVAEGDNLEDFDNLIVENMEESQVSSRDFSQLIQRKVSTVNNDHLRMPQLLSKIALERERLETEMKEGLPNRELTSLRINLNRSYSEILRRASAALAAFTFTLLGISFGINISRRQSNRGVFYVVAIAAGYLSLYFAAKGLDHMLLASALAYFLPHVFIIGLSLWMLRRISKGLDQG